MHFRSVVVLGRHKRNPEVIQNKHLTRDRYNIEAMAAFLPVDKFFKHVYLVDLSPSLCEVARERFERLGWNNVTVLCQDARSFRLPEKDNAASDGADLITMSYSLSMIPGEYLRSPRKTIDVDCFRLLQRCRLINLPLEVDWNAGCV